MNKQQLQQMLTSPYESNTWKKVLIDIFGVKNIPIQPRPINLPSNELAINAFELGNFETSDERAVGIFEVNLKPNIKVEANKIGIKNLLESIYKYDVDAALITFVDSSKQKWRFSFVSDVNIRNEETQAIERKTTEEKKSRKRFTYVLGVNEICRTATERFWFLNDKPITLQDLYEAFNVDKLNKDFFKGYKERYENLWQYINSQTEYRNVLIDSEQTEISKIEKPIRDFAKKLLGRIVFLYFLQKKGWLGVPATQTDWKDGDAEFIKHLFQNANDKSRFYADYLVELFFDTLNKDRKSDNDIFRPTNSKVPYLNGGLFDNDAPQTNHFNFPESYFTDLFDFFEQYNFTIDENSPDDAEVGIDPEMLGHIFENLLEENKDKGAFYTPKEVVQFMCQEALVQYLKPHFTEEASIEGFIRKKDISDFLKKKEEAQKLDKLLSKVRICDPAIGSGAFPIGILQEIFEAKRFIFPYLHINNFDAAEVKLQIIEYSIYGIDLDKGAVDIARLRFWLALVVDEDTPRPLPNLDYKIMQGNSLFDTFEGIDISKIHQQNLKIFEPERDLFGNLTKPQLTIFQSQSTEDINKLLDEYFDIVDTDRKKQIRKQVNEYVHEHIDFNIELRGKQLERQIAEAGNPANMTPKTKKAYEVLLNNKSKIEESRQRLHELQERVERPFFLWKLYFKEVFDRNPDGFDIVIGNPPYFSISKQPQLKELSKHYKTFEPTGDIYSLFYERGHQILRSGGVLVYITGSSWLRSNYGQSLRKFFREETNPLKLIDLSDCQIFESATVLTTIMAYRKQANINTLAALRLTRRTQYAVKQLNNYFDANHIQLQTQPDEAWVILDRTRYDLKQKIEIQGVKLKEWDLTINYGIKTGLNDAFVLESTAGKDLLISKDNTSKNLLKPLLRGRDVERYGLNFKEQWLIGTFPVLKIDIEHYPAIKEHLLDFGQAKLEQSGEVGSRKKTSSAWFETQDNIAYWKDFEKPKIIYPNMVKDISFAYDDKGFYANDKCFILTGEKLKYLLGVFNSKLFRYIFEENFPELQGNSREIKSFVMNEIPIKIPSEQEEKNISIVADYLLYLYEATHERVNPYADNKQVAGFFEDIMNHLVCELYFEEEMIENGIVMKPVLELTAIDQLNEAKQGEIIGEVFKRLQTPGSPVRKCIAMANIKLPDTIGKILSNTI